MGKAEGNTPKQMKRVPRFVISGQCYIQALL